MLRRRRTWKIFLLTAELSWIPKPHKKIKFIKKKKEGGDWFKLRTEEVVWLLKFVAVEEAVFYPLHIFSMP